MIPRASAHCSLFLEPEETQTERMQRVAELYDLDPEVDKMEIAARAASSLPDEEDGTWTDVALCTLRNGALAAALLTALGALPGPASASPSMAETHPFLLLADAETLDVIASIAVPLIIGGALTAFAAANFEKLIDKVNEGR